MNGLHPSQTPQLIETFQRSIMSGFPTYVGLYESCVISHIGKDTLQYCYNEAIRNMQIKPFFEFNGRFVEGWSATNPQFLGSEMGTLPYVIAETAYSNNREGYMNMISRFKLAGGLDKDIRKSHDAANTWIMLENQKIDSMNSLAPKHMQQKRRPAVVFNWMGLM